MTENKKDKPPFFDIDKRLLSKRAKDYHNEVLFLTLNLRDTFNKASRTLLLCEKDAKIMMNKTSGFLPTWEYEDFEELSYHLENFWLRSFNYREKICQLINCVLGLQFSEKSSLFPKLLEDSIVRISGLHKELQKFNNDKTFKSILTKRKHLTHRIYYETPVAGYDRAFRPISKSTALSLTLWLANMRKEVRSVERFLDKVFDLNDSIMIKLIAYVKNNK